MRALFFPRHNRDLDLFEPGGFEKLMKLHFAEAEPVVGVKLSGAFETVAEQIEDHDAAAPAQDAVRAGDGALGMDRMMPPEPTSNAHARISAIGNPARTRTMTNRVVHAAGAHRKNRRAVMS
jgi:hypothetical protein